MSTNIENIPLAWIWDEEESFGIDGPKLVLYVSINEIDALIAALQTGVDLHFVNQGKNRISGTDSVDIMPSRINEISKRDGKITIQINNIGLQKFVEAIAALKVAGSLTYFDLDDEIVVEHWEEFIITTSNEVYQAASAA